MPLGSPVVCRSIPFRRVLQSGAAWCALVLCFVSNVQAEEWVSLFNGKDLAGWTQKNGTATYRVEAETIIGKTSEGSPNSFLCSDVEYGDFELKFEVLVDDALNSGVQIRSASLPERNNGRVHGPQVEIATNGTAGYIYGEALDTGWLTTDMSSDAARSAFKAGEWNVYHVVAKGKHLTTSVNGIPVADYQDEKTGMLKGFIGLQVHGIGAGEGPYQVRWRNIQLKNLDQ